MKTLLRIAKSIILIWGGISLLGVFIFAGSVAYQVYFRNKSDVATSRDVRFVLNWCRLGDERIEKILDSYESPGLLPVTIWMLMRSRLLISTSVN